MKKICVVGLALVLMMGGMITSVSAAPYVSANFGLVTTNEANLNGSGISGELSTDSGFGFIAAVGNNFDGLRGEAEISYRANDLDKFAGGTSGPVNGDMRSLAVMGNLLLDISLRESIRPFVGAGIGLANIDLNSRDLVNTDDTVFAYQAIAGLGFPLTHVTTLDIQYRYFATTEPDFDGVEAEYQTHDFFAGLRFDF